MGIIACCPYFSETRDADLVCKSHTLMSKSSLVCFGETRMRA